ncbi:MAG: hypothetical protein U0836_07980 [Pirellulales bacterium]
MELRDALSQITEIRRQLARSETFRGYRAAPVALSGLLAMSAAAVQARLWPEPTEHVAAYAVFWVSIAAISMAGAGAEMALRARRASSELTREITLLAVEQFLPCVLAGGLSTIVIVQSAAEIGWILPGLWGLFFSLGVFASCRLLPRPTIWIAGYYLVAGMLCLTLARGPAALSPWAMALMFGPGQLFAAAVLYWTLERNDESH